MTRVACDRCHEVFWDYEGESRWERLGELPTDGVGYMLCPYCGCDEISDAEECEECGEYYHPDELTDIEDRYLCPVCAGAWTKIKAS